MLSSMTFCLSNSAVNSSGKPPFEEPGEEVGSPSSSPSRPTLSFVTRAFLGLHWSHRFTRLSPHWDLPADRSHDLVPFTRPQPISPAHGGRLINVSKLTRLKFPGS